MMESNRRKVSNPDKPEVAPSAIADSDTGASAAPPMRDAIDTPKGRRLPKTMRTIAWKSSNGETLYNIACEVGVTEMLVGRYLDEVVRYLHCQPWRTADRVTQEDDVIVPGKDRRPSRPSGELKPDQVMIEARCASCGAAIAADAERVLDAAMTLNYSHPADEWDAGHQIKLRVGRVLHYCLDCARKTEEFRMPNPWFVSEEEERVLAEWVDEDNFVRVLPKTEEERVLAQRDRKVKEAVDRGDVHAFNVAMPTTPGRNDVMASAEQISHAAERAVKSSDTPNPQAISDMADSIMAGEVRIKSLRPGVASNLLGEAKQRAMLDEYLKSAASRNKFPPNVRDSLKMWVEGASQSAVARKFNTDQGTISKRIKAALASAYARR
jgi:hypothetical protein